MRKHLPLLLAGIFLMLSCINNEQIIEVKDSRKLIPEGIAVDPNSGKIFLSSLHQEKIVVVDKDGNINDLIETNQHGFLSGIGMTVHDGKLYAASNALNPEPGETFVFVLDPSTGELINKYQLQDTSIHLFNDLAVTREGKMYVTDTYTNAIYSIEAGGEQPQLFLRSEEIKWPNGIALSADDKYLYVASTTNGIRVIDPQSAEILSPADTVSAGIDGLQLYRNSLIGIQNSNRPVNKVLRFYLDDSGTKIINSEVLMEDHSHFDVPTTLDIQNNTMYILANSQLRNLNQEENYIIDSSTLQDVYIILQDL